MATVRFLRPFNVDSVNVSGEDIVSANNTLIRQDDGRERVDYRGSFNVSGSNDDLNVSGRLQSIDYFISGRQIVDVTGLNSDAAVVARLVGNENTQGFLSFIFSRADNATLSGGADRMRGFGGNDRIDGKGGNDSVFGGLGNDTIIGGAGRDRLNGDAGADVLNGGASADILSGGGGNDRLNGGGANDRMNGGGGADRLLGGAGNDNLNGGGANDRLVGGGGGDTVIGGGGADDILGGGGNDMLTGGRGGDTFLFARRDGSDTITDFRQNQDKIEITSGATRFGQLDIDQAGANVTISFAQTTITVLNATENQFDGSDFMFT